LSQQKRKPQDSQHEDTDEWGDILDEIDLEYLPIEYIQNIIVTFEDDTVWDINISDSKKNQTIESIEDSLDELFDNYEDTIITIDFRLDVNKVKKDLTKRVKRFLKNK
jgi:hypothetical protein